MAGRYNIVRKVEGKGTHAGRVFWRQIGAITINPDDKGRAFFDMFDGEFYVFRDTGRGNAPGFDAQAEGLPVTTRDAITEGQHDRAEEPNRELERRLRDARSPRAWGNPASNAGGYRHDPNF